MTLGRTLAYDLAAGVLLAVILAAADGWRGVRGCGAAWVVCLVPLVVPRRTRWVAVGAGRPRIGGGWGLLHTRDILLRMAWTLAAGAGLYYRFGDDIGVGFWIALLVFYQVTLTLRTAGLVARPAETGDRATDAPG